MIKDNIFICKRVNNSKRAHLVLNKAQCKHYPYNPAACEDMLLGLVRILRDYYRSEHVLVVGFAETATAIGWFVADCLGWDFIQTTRENMTGYYSFDESHSHAVEQKLAIVDFDKYDRVLFIDDEVTTGKTILHIMEKINIDFKCNFGVASLINSMNDMAKEVFKSKKIPLHYLCYLEVDEKQFKEDLSKFTYKQVGVLKTGIDDFVEYKLCDFDVNLGNPRLGLSEWDFNEVTRYVADHCRDLASSDKILILGTEEFMYPAIKVGASLVRQGFNVLSHSTTRSPIAISDDYILKDGFKLGSVYDKDRETYIYNLDEYDRVFIITEKSASNFSDLIKILVAYDNKDITVIRIGE